MTGGEDQAQQIVADVIVQRGVEIRHGQLLLDLELTTELLVLALEHLAATQPVDRAMLRGGHEPGARVVRDARLRPLLECGDECVLREPLRAPVEGGWRPSSASSTPAFCRDSLYFVIAATALASGMAPGAAFSYPLGIISIMNRIVGFPPGFGFSCSPLRR